jgi:ribosomal-protein-alanine N-acetyltransferase
MLNHLKNDFTSERLFIRNLEITDTSFIYTLVNTNEWKQFIGERNIHSEEDALPYIQNILNNDHVNYWVVTLKDTQTPVGIVTFIKKDYLAYHDLGFAFLPTYMGKGYAYEAAKEVLDYLLQQEIYKNIVAVTVNSNQKSKLLLSKLGFKFERVFNHHHDVLELYSIKTNQSFS